jgi:acyl carrier protein
MENEKIMENVTNEMGIKREVKQILADVLQLDDMSLEAIGDEQPFFGTEEIPGLIQDSLAVLEISTRLADSYDILPSDLKQTDFVNVNSLVKFILRCKNS